MQKKITVMVTGVGGGGPGEQILKALRLAKTKYEIIGGDISPLSRGLNDVDFPYLMPFANHPKYISSILAVCKKHHVQALFIGSDPELRIISQHRQQIQKAGIFLPINPQWVIDACMDKSKTAEILSKLGFHSPKTIIVSSLKDAREIRFFPAVLKPITGGSGSANVMIAQSTKELLAISQHLFSIYPRFIAQQYLGTPDKEYTAGVLCSMDGDLINSIAVKRMILTGLSNKIKIANRLDKNKYGPILAISSGISQGEIGHFPKITRTCEKIALTLGCTGVMNIQCRFVDNKVYVFEINPRFSGTTSLRAMVGYNEPDVLVRKHILDEKIKPRFFYKSGTIIRGLVETFIKNTNFQDASELI